ncbi:hypothetical protein ACHAW5_002068 [Stephanodiscus triporus]|uniref:Uncharacterized protein n=1 Tax=Stephanodiscus triporus TaxID=2934178 RepID=A0ABD3P090_9STRA
MPSKATTVAAIAVGCSLLAYGASRLSKSKSSSSKRPKTDLDDLDDVDDDDKDCIAPDDVVAVFDKLFMTMQQVVMQLSQQVQQIQMSGQVIPEKQLRQLLKAEFERALIACQEQVFEDNDVDADCLEEATWEFMEKPEEYPKVKRAVERFQKLYESISGEDVVGWTPRGGGGSDDGGASSAVVRKDLSPVELMTAAAVYFDAITKSMIELADAWRAAGRDLKDPKVVTQFQLEASTDANEAGEGKLESEMGITMGDFRSAIDKHSRIPSVGQTLGMLQMKQQQELIAAGVPM